MQGAESWGKGIDVAQGPDINIARVPQGGRTYEAFGEDPSLTTRTAVANIEGIQRTGVMADVKHFAANNQETQRMSINENVSQRALREIYLPAFGAAVTQAGAASLMCAYNQVNTKYACQNPYLLNNLLDKQFKFTGFVRSDLGAVHDVGAAFDAGLDQLKPGEPRLLAAAVRSGRVPIARLNDAVSRVLREMFRFRLFNRHSSGTPNRTVTTSQHAAIAARTAEQGSVLLKNTGGLLPFDRRVIGSIAVIGSDAGPDARTHGYGSSAVSTAPVVTPYEGIRHRAGAAQLVTYTSSPDLTVPASVLTASSSRDHGLRVRVFGDNTFAGRPILTTVAGDVNFHSDIRDIVHRTHFRHAPNPAWSATWTGTLRAPETGWFQFLLTTDDTSRLLLDRRLLIDNTDPTTARGPRTSSGRVYLVAGQPYPIEVDYQADHLRGLARLDWIPPTDSYQPVEQAARSAEVAVVFAGDAESEGTDRANLSLPDEQDTLISKVAAANPNTVVVLNTGSAVTMPWLDQVKAVIEGWYPGQQDGNAVAALLFGDVNPSGKLPITFPRSAEDTPAHQSAQWPGTYGTADYSEGIDVGYRWYDTHGIQPLFPFGFGLSYTTFRVHNVAIRGRLASGGTESVSASVTNTGTRTGAEVVQLYVGVHARTGEPPEQLKGYDKVSLKPGRTRRVDFTLNRNDLAYWSDTTNRWVTEPGRYTIMVGTSSQDIAATATLHIP